ncbi:MAG: hypothetical protein J7539_04470 [Niabella sp.]|nr:hypothetical protein [Niabella sp.]
MNRGGFLKLGTMAAFSPLVAKVNAAGRTAKPTDRALLQRLIAANDRRAASVLETVGAGNLRFSRMIAYDIAVLAAAYAVPGGSYYHSDKVVASARTLVDFLQKAQQEDGTVNVGNLESPPDTAFVIEILCPVVFILKKESRKDVQLLLLQLQKVIVKAGQALVTGGVHTPNHRWVVCSALSYINALYPDVKYQQRIEDWLGEGVFLDADGHFAERSGIYSAVIDTALINIARFTNQPELYEPVRRNLAMYYYYMEPNGDLVTNDSRRQDQYQVFAKSAAIFYLQYRYMAVHDKDGRFAAVTKFIENTAGFEEEVLPLSLFHFLENTVLQETLPTAAPLPVAYEKLFPTSRLLRIKRNAVSVTLFGGADLPLLVASGRSNAPDFFSYRKGDAILKYLRLSAAFFNTGYFYSDSLEQKGNEYILHRKLEVPYYQPLPKEQRNAAGNYKLTPSVDGRFWNKMDFPDRPVSNVKILDTTVRLSADNGAPALHFDIKGMKDVAVTIELCFKEGAGLLGVTAAGNDNYFPEQGTAEYRSGTDRIRFGPGIAAHRQISNLEGEQYSTHFGTLRTNGMHVYLTGITPFSHTLQFS